MNKEPSKPGKVWPQGIDVFLADAKKELKSRGLPDDGGAHYINGLRRLVNSDALVRDDEQAGQLVKLIDEGVMTNLPSCVALATLINTWPKKRPTGIR